MKKILYSSSFEACWRKDNIIFNEEAIGAIFEASGGIPRRINHICAMSLVIGFGRKVKTVDVDITREAAETLVG